MIEDISMWLAGHIVGKYEDIELKYVLAANGIPIQCNENESDLQVYRIGKRLIRVRTDFPKVNGKEIFCDREFLKLPFGIYEINLLEHNPQITRVKDSYTLVFTQKTSNKITVNKTFIKSLFR